MESQPLFLGNLPTFNMKGIATTAVIMSVGGFAISTFMGWNIWLSLSTIDNKTSVASLTTSVTDIQETVHEIARHDNIQVSEASTTPL